MYSQPRRPRVGGNPRAGLGGGSGPEISGIRTPRSGADQLANGKNVKTGGDGAGLVY